MGAIDKAIQLQPKDKQENPNLYNEKWWVLQRLKRYAEAEVAINKAIALNPRAAFIANRGSLYYKLQKWELLPSRQKNTDVKNRQDAKSAKKEDQEDR